MPEHRLERTRAAYRNSLQVYSTPLTRMYDHEFSPDDFRAIYAHWPVPHPVDHQWWCGGKEPCACTEGWKEEQRMMRANGRL